MRPAQRILERQKLKERIRRALLFGGVFFVALGVYFPFSEEYRVASQAAVAPSVAAKLGEVRFKVLILADVHYADGASSTIRLYLVGTKANGSLTVLLSRRRGAFVIDRALLDGNEVDVPHVAWRSLLAKHDA